MLGLEQLYCWLGEDGLGFGAAGIVMSVCIPSKFRACAVLSTEDGLDRALPVCCIFRGSFGLVPGERTLERVFAVVG